MKNVPSLEERVSIMDKEISSADINKLNAILAAKTTALQTVSQCNDMLRSLEAKQQEKTDLMSGLDILAKVKSGKYVIVDTESMDSVKFKFM